jgi:RNA polymerase sigma-70 factor (ECF subfamily)
MDGLRERYRAARRAAVTGADDADPVAELADPSADVEEQTVESERERDIIERVREAISQLPDTQREVVELHKLRGMSMADVAQRLQVREGAVRVRAHRAYKALARLLGPHSGASSWLLLLARWLE